MAPIGASQLFDFLLGLACRDPMATPTLLPGYVLLLGQFYFFFLTSVGFFVAASLANRSARKRAVFSPVARRSAS
jgi:hypothetical protein